MGKRVTKQYDMEFKLGAVELVERQGYSVPAAAESLGVSKSNLYTWRRHSLWSSRGPSSAGSQTGAADG